MGIAEVVKALGFSAPETEIIAAKIYSIAGERILVYASGFIRGCFADFRADQSIKLTDRDLKRLVVRATLASGLAAHVAALAEADVPIETIRLVIEDVFKWVDEKKAVARGMN